MLPVAFALSLSYAADAERAFGRRRRRLRTLDGSRTVLPVAFALSLSFAADAERAFGRRRRRLRTLDGSRFVINPV
ncbi:hypothetical protein [Marinactinospora rubrisoli]|uniref:Secreted protein n=1 Tax=Marinactinospora rubrisoli TaxID=2715399 RepID=A0ABW2KCY3_9ACTN